MPGPMNLY